MLFKSSTLYNSVQRKSFHRSNWELWVQYGWWDINSLLNQDRNATEALINKRMYSSVLYSNASVTLWLVWLIFLKLSVCTVPVFQSQSHHCCRRLGMCEPETSWLGVWSAGRQPPKGWKSQVRCRGGGWCQTPSQGRASLQSWGIPPEEKGRSIHHFLKHLAL